jgi:protocatechuate 3,4-dioxygenase alpha subunit
MKLPPTSSQTVGPFFHLGVSFLTREHLEARGISGQLVTIRGRVLDGDGKPLPDALLEIWQADAAGRYAADRSGLGAGSGADGNSAPRFQGFGRVETDQEGAFCFTTVKPGPVPYLDGGMQAPHIVVTVFSRGLLKPLWTRLYFPDEPGNATDPILKLVPPGRRATLIARRSGESARNSLEDSRENILEWHVVMQGGGETVFFDY